eukprot:TRINITY_DN7317_c0_g1_i1.p1 TRINITY_DN7317_c0_g1~~TRINITY_DN7317_c0_g1_i1.p1  ORF type:complete len:692 (-),score=190.76 TRINITY_DN7317_c0_g1_i1:141-2159(-)
MAEAFQLSPFITRSLCDKLYDKRKQGAVEIERMVKEMCVAKDYERIQGLTQYLIESFCANSNANHRKGGLIALAAVSIGMGSEVSRMISYLTPPVLNMFIDADSRVRYYACEAMYNIAKVARQHILVFFNEIFDGLCKLSADPDAHVKSGTLLLDKLVKDIVTECESFNIEKFVPLLKERVYAINPFVRQFLISWISVLHSVPRLDMITYLPEFLDGLYGMLSDKDKEIRREANNLLCEFLRDIQVSELDLDYGAMIDILLPHCKSQDQITRHSALMWIDDFIGGCNDKVLPYVHLIVAALLPSLSHEDPTIQGQASKANSSLLQLIQSTSEHLEIQSFLTNVTSQFKNDYVNTRLAALRWVLIIHNKARSSVEEHIDDLFPSLLALLHDPAELVVRSDLEVMAKVASKEEYFLRLMGALVDLYRKDLSLLERRCSLITRQLSLFISPEKIYRALANIVLKEKDLVFASIMIQTLNVILLTSSELHEMRLNLKNLMSPESRDLFTTLYRSWSHNPAATFSLCLLAQAYEHAASLVLKFAELQISVQFLVEIDKLVQLLESPIFIGLRMHLLEPEKYPFLFKALYGLLMLLPQGTAFETLRSRLNCVSTLGVLQLIPKEAPDNFQLLAHRDMNFSELLSHFLKVQETHHNFRHQAEVARASLMVQEFAIDNGE